jgi:multiple sugar transport system ATP-binding protein
MIYFDIGKTTLCASIDPEAGAKAGEEIVLSVNMNQMHLFDAETGMSLTPVP